MGIATWDGRTWSPAGSGVLGSVHALAALPNGDIVAGGEIEVGGLHPGSSVAIWDRERVECLGSGMTGIGSDRPVVRALAVLPNGDLLAGGRFSAAGGVNAPALARWDGTAWSAVGGSMAGGLTAVNALVVLRNGDVVAGGNFSSAGGVAASSIARWDGDAWHALTAGIHGEVHALIETPNGDLFVGGAFSRSACPAVGCASRPTCRCSRRDRWERCA